MDCRRIALTDLAERHKNNCGTALSAYLRFLGQNRLDRNYPDELRHGDRYYEGARKQITVNAYQRDRRAGNRTIEVHG
jgi:5-methylcytosine-specific restriction protein A